VLSAVITSWWPVCEQNGGVNWRWR